MKIGAARVVIGLCLMALLLTQPGAAALGGLNAMLCWARTVAPAMFPFMALLPLITGPSAAGVYQKLLGRPMERLFRLPGSAAGAVVAGMLGGSPAGALAARRVPGLTRGQLRRLTAVAGFSPAFLVGGVGAGMLGRADWGWMLLRAQVMTQLTLLVLLRFAWGKDETPVSAGSVAQSAAPLREAVMAILTVGGWMTLFGALGQAARQLPGGWADVAVCLADVVTGAQRAASLPLAVEEKLPLLSALCGFGGLCVGLQNLSILGKDGPAPAQYFALRLPAAGLSALFTEAQLRFPMEISLSAEVPMLPIAALAASLLALTALTGRNRTTN